MKISQATRENYAKHFGPLAFVPGYCGKCPGADLVDGDPICTVFAEDGAPRILPRRDGCNEPPDWCPIRHLSERYATNGSSEQ